MRVLLDECLPTQLRHSLPGHDVRSVRYMRWTGQRNGALLALMQAHGFEVLVTVDQSLRHQQNLAAAGVAVVLLQAASNRYPDLAPLAPAVLTALAALNPGDVVEITAPQVPSPPAR
jgi:hypothetical protein